MVPAAAQLLAPRLLVPRLLVPLLPAAAPTS
jgi:hypothetical protein